MNSDDVISETSLAENGTPRAARPVPLNSFVYKTSSSGCGGLFIANPQNFDAKVPQPPAICELCGIDSHSCCPQHRVVLPTLSNALVACRNAPRDSSAQTPACTAKFKCLICHEPICETFAQRIPMPVLQLRPSSRSHDIHCMRMWIFASSSSTMRWSA